MGYLTGITVFFIIVTGISLATGYSSSDRNIREAGFSLAVLAGFFCLFFSVLLAFASHGA